MVTSDDEQTTDIVVEGTWAARWCRVPAVAAAAACLPSPLLPQALLQPLLNHTRTHIPAFFTQATTRRLSGFGRRWG